MMHEQDTPQLVDEVGSADSVMSQTIQAGVRQFAFAGQADNAIAGSITNVEYVISGAAGGNQPSDNRQPYLTLNYAIALEGSSQTRIWRRSL